MITTCPLSVWMMLISLAVAVSGQFQCRPGWLMNDNVCYHFSHDREEWPVAQTVCRILGGHLAEIRSAAEDTFVTHQVTRDYWIGGNDLQVEGKWRWVDSDDPITYGNWASGQPDNYDGEENCVHMFDNGKWNDEDCSESMHYICEYRGEKLEIIG